MISNLASPWGRTLLIALTVLAAAQPAGAASGEKARINAARAQADATLAEQEAECRKRFVVTSCLIEARQQHRAVVEPLREELIRLDERQRRQRALDRAERLRARSEAAAGGATAADAAGSQSAESAPRSLIRPKLRSVEPVRQETSPAAPEPSAAPAPEPVVAAPPRPPTGAPVKPMDPAQFKASEERIREAEARREAVLRRNAERDAKKPPAAPLPIPATAPAAQPGAGATR